MDLLEDIGRSYRTGVNVESNEDEAAVMMLAVFADVLALHGSHIGTKGERTFWVPVPLPPPRIMVSRIKPLKSPISEGSLIPLRGAVETAGSGL
jgi:hypothetical protein